MYIFILYDLGYRINSLDAAKAIHFTDNDVILIDQLNMDWADIYFFYDDKEDKYHTSIAEKKWFLYDSSVSICLYNYKEDSIKTIGSIAYENDKGKSIIALLIESMDPEVDYVEAKLDGKVVRSKVMIGDPRILSFKGSSNISQLELVAYNIDREGLYYYGYPKGTDCCKDEDYKWHIIEDKSL